MVLLLFVLGVAIYIAYGVYGQYRSIFLSIIVVLCGVGGCFYLNSGCIGEVFSGNSYKSNEYHLVLDSKLIEIKMTSPTIGISGINEVSYAVPLSSIGKDVYDSFSLLRRWLYTGGVTQVKLILYSEDRYGNKIENDKGVIIKLNSDDVSKFNSYSSFNREYNIEGLISEYSFDRVPKNPLLW